MSEKLPKSKSVRRVLAALQDAGLDARPIEMPDDTRTAAAAAATVGCTEDQIAKSIIFWGAESDRGILFVTAGGRQVDKTRAAELAGEALGRADAAQVRAQTGFAIGGVAPVGHVTPPRVFFDRHLLAFDRVWAAAGTPRHVFEIAPQTLVEITGGLVADFSVR